MEIDAAVLRSLAEQVASRAVPGRASLVAIDGFGGAGKSVLACGLRRVVADARIVEADDFWRPSPERPGRERVIAEPGCDYDHARLAREVLEPLSAGRDAVYRRYDWVRDRCMETHVVPGSGVVIVEGVFVLLPALRGFFDLKVWVETPDDVRLARGIRRDGERGRDLWENEWMMAYTEYGKRYAPWMAADVVVRGDG